MSILFSLLLIAAGAVLTFVIDHEAQGVDIRILGAVFLAGGIVSLVFAIAFRVLRASRRQKGSADSEPDDKREAALRDRV